MNNNLNTFLSRISFICWPIADLLTVMIDLLLTLIVVFLNIYRPTPIQYHSP